MRCRESLRIQNTAKHALYAVRLKGEILNKISAGTFNYSDYFPRSKRLALFGQMPHAITMGALLRGYLATCTTAVAFGQMSPSTLDGYERMVNYIWLPKLGETKVVDVTPGLLREIIGAMGVTAKTVRNYLQPVRSVLDDAVTDDVIALNPLTKVDLKKLLRLTTTKSKYVVDPFNVRERAALLAACKEPQERNFLRFAFYSGLRTSELIALAWPNIDWISGTVRVDSAFVAGVLKNHTKTAAGMRHVMLTPQASLALTDQKQYTLIAGGGVFLNPRTDAPWTDDNQIRLRFQRICLLAGVRYRNPYQTRHTYASIMLTNGENEYWLAEQMGHVDPSMIRKHYGKFIKEDGPNAGYTPRSDWSKLDQVLTDENDKT